MSDSTYEEVEDILNEEDRKLSQDVIPDKDSENEKMNPDDVLGPAKRAGIRRLNKNAVLAVIILGGIIIMGVVSFFPDMKKKKAQENSIYADNKPDVRKLVGSPRVAELPSGVVLTGSGTNTKGVEYGVESPYQKARRETINRVEQAPVRNAPVTETYQEQPISKSAIKVQLGGDGEAYRQTASRVNPYANQASYDMTGLAGLDIGTGGVSTYGSDTIPYVSAQYVPSSTTAPTRAEEYNDANSQEQKNRFYDQEQNGAATITGSYLPVGRVITQGTVIPGVLITAINTDLPGPVKAYVTENVYDTLSGVNILIPQGSMLLAEYNSSVTWGQKRVQVSWTRIIRPDGYSINLAGDPGIDRTGASGYNAIVDEHPLAYLKGLGVVLAFTMLNGQLQATNATINPGLSDLMNATNETINDIGSDYVGRVMDIQPTLKVKSGSKIQIFINNDIVF